ncbi:uncharacterized protein YndB with AHSA1/START domain [Saccharothrix coeruleofusca]|uniref:SRPBCC family protein n=1 Tax=Saccharothrix coeruleofusca TaxID=33919 RepID=UPI001AEACABD|nr:SRPBCC family protein [Saccharothrix coeruleofusca]MBP2338104.1 uncharacterized protein YndB with AHSA1/START domain [Saccharothrix coeruleofusca]
MDARLEIIGGKPVLRVERLLAHPPTKVWRAIREPAQLAHWFPATVEVDGVTMRFTFPEGGPTGSGEVLESDPPRVFAFRWNEDVLRFELLPRDESCLLVFTQVIGAGPLGAARNAAGWATCLDALDDRLADRPHTPTTDWLPLLERWVREFGLDQGEAEGLRVRFARDLMWRSPDELWALLTEGARPEVGGPPPARAANPHVEPGPVTAVEAPQLLEFDSPRGRVRWEFEHDPERGTAVVLTHEVSDRAAVPTALAAWHVHLELFFAALFGEIRCPWPQDRTEELEAHYRMRTE